MKKTLAILALTLTLIVALGFMPAMAAPKDEKKVDVSILSYLSSWTYLNNQFPAGQNPYYPVYFDSIRYFEPGHVKLVGAGVPPADFETMQVWNTGYLLSTITIDGTAYPLVSCNAQHLEYNHHTKSMIAQCEAVWFIGSMGDVSNGFEGKVFIKYFNWNILTRTYDLRIVNADLQGFGIYEGQKLHVTYEGGMPPAPQEWTGYILVP